MSVLSRPEFHDEQAASDCVKARLWSQARPARNAWSESAYS